MMTHPNRTVSHTTTSVGRIKEEPIQITDWTEDDGVRFVGIIRTRYASNIRFFGAFHVAKIVDGKAVMREGAKPAPDFARQVIAGYTGMEVV